MRLKAVVRSLASKPLDFQRSESKFAWILIAVFLLILFNPFLPNQGWGGYIFHLAIIKSPKVTANIICGAVAGYLLIGLSGAFIALFIETMSPGAFLLGGEVPVERG